MLRIDIGETKGPPNRWALLFDATEDAEATTPAVQIAAGSAWLSLVTVLSCSDGRLGSRPVVEHVFEGVQAMLQRAGPIARREIIAMDPVWRASDWQAAPARAGRDQALLGYGVLGSALLAVPFGTLLEQVEAGFAWALTAGLTGAALLGMARIERAVARPHVDALALLHALAASRAFDAPRVPWAAPALHMPVLVTHHGRRMLNMAQVSTTLLRACNQARAVDARLVLRRIQWPKHTHRTCRLVPQSWIGIEMAAPEAVLEAAPSWMRVERADGLTRSVVAKQDSSMRAVAERVVMGLCGGR